MRCFALCLRSGSAKVPVDNGSMQIVKVSHDSFETMRSYDFPPCGYLNNAQTADRSNLTLRLPGAIRHLEIRPWRFGVINHLAEDGESSGLDDMSPLGHEPCAMSLEP